MDTVFDFDENMRMRQVRGTELRWYDAKEARFGLFGSDALSEDGFCRMTQAERAHLLPVNEGEAWLGEHSAGIGLQFETDSAQLFVRVKNRSGFDMTNMTLIGQTGIDLYVYDESLSRYRLHEVGRGNFEDSEYELSLGHFSDRPRRKRKYLMYLPLYMSTLRLEIGLDKESEIIPVPFENKERICVYGTSITQGCSASRPGMAYTNILSRRLCCEVLNFGFSGSAFMEKEMGEILGKRKLDLLIVDAEPNAGCDERMKDNAEKFLNAFFDGNPHCPVVLYSRILFALDTYDENRVRLREFYKDFLKKLALRFRKKGKRVYFADGSKILGEEYTEWTADGIHPDDVGMKYIADHYEKTIKRIKKELQR